MINFDFILNSPLFGYESQNFNFNDRYDSLVKPPETTRKYRNLTKILGYIPVISRIVGLYDILWGLFKIAQDSTSAVQPSPSIPKPDITKIAAVYILRGAVEFSGLGPFLAVSDLFITIFRPDQKSS